MSKEANGNNRKSFLLFVCFFVSINCFSQRTEEWKQYLKDSVYKSDKPEYIYLYLTKAGKLQKHLNYSLKKGQNILSINYGDSLVVYKFINNYNLFDIVKENLKEIKKVKDYLNTENSVVNFRKNFANSNIIFNQLGIKYADLHYNHFPKFSVDEIEKKQNKKRKDGMIIINKLYAILEIAEQNK